MNNPYLISESLETFFRVKILKFFDADPDPGWKYSNPGSGINIPDPQHCSHDVQRMERLRLESEKTGEEDDEYECHVCSANLYLSLVGSCLPFLPSLFLYGIEEGKKRLMRKMPAVSV
jgi:hypothetical protein